MKTVLKIAGIGLAILVLLGFYLTITEEPKELTPEQQAQVEADAKEQAKEDADLQRKEKIEAQFSKLNGAHKELEKMILREMTNPDSYEHIETTYFDRGEQLWVTTRFRGQNRFGGMEEATVKAKVDLEGNILEVINEQ